VDIFGIITSILLSLQGIAILLVVFGVISAFLWKIAFYVQLGLGLVVTIIATYSAYAATQMLNLPSTWALLVLGIGIIATLIQAFLAAVMAIVNGFGLAWLGVFLSIIDRSMGQIDDLEGLITRLGGTLITSAIIALVVIGAAAFAGGHLFSIFKIPGRKSVKRFESRGEVERTSGNGELPGHNEETRIRRLENPTSGYCRICQEEWFIYNEVCGCPDCGANFHLDCIREYLGKSHRCPQCQKRAILSLN